MEDRLRQHKKDKHGTAGVLKETKNNYKTSKISVEIPCDICDFTSSSVSDFLKHIEIHEKEEESVTLPSDLCDYEVSTIDHLKNT